MRYIVHKKIREEAARSVAWVKGLVAAYDTSLLGWVRLDFGREHRDRSGNIRYRYQGVYGRCWYPTQSQPTIRLSCQVPGPFPCDIETRKSPIYRNADGSWPGGLKVPRRLVQRDPRTGREWKRVYGQTRVLTLDEAIVWIFSHEAFHWLRATKQIPGRNNEVEADAYADAQLETFRGPQRETLPAPPIIEDQLPLPGLG